MSNLKKCIDEYDQEIGLEPLNPWKLESIDRYNHLIVRLINIKTGEIREVEMTIDDVNRLWEIGYGFGHTSKIED